MTHCDQKIFKDHLASSPDLSELRAVCRSEGSCCRFEPFSSKQVWNSEKNDWELTELELNKMKLTKNFFKPVHFKGIQCAIKIKSELPWTEVSSPVGVRIWGVGEEVVGLRRPGHVSIVQRLQVARWGWVDLRIEIVQKLDICMEGKVCDAWSRLRWMHSLVVVMHMQCNVCNAVQCLWCGWTLHVIASL